MTEQQIRKEQAAATLKYEVAAQVRKTIEEAKQKYKTMGGGNLDDLEEEIIELVQG